MTALQLIGWRPGIKSVSLIRAMKEHATGSLTESKRLLEDLLDGKTVTLEFRTEEEKEKFRLLAEELGAVTG